MTMKRDMTKFSHTCSKKDIATLEQERQELVDKLTTIDYHIQKKRRAIDTERVKQIIDSSRLGEHLPEVVKWIKSWRCVDVVTRDYADEGVNHYSIIVTIELDEYALVYRYIKDCEPTHPEESILHIYEYHYPIINTGETGVEELSTDPVVANAGVAQIVGAPCTDIELATIMTQIFDFVAHDRELKQEPEHVTISPYSNRLRELYFAN